MTWPFVQLILIARTDFNNLLFWFLFFLLIIVVESLGKHLIKKIVILSYIAHNLNLFHIFLIFKAIFFHFFFWIFYSIFFSWYFILLRKPIISNPWVSFIVKFFRLSFRFLLPQIFLELVLFYVVFIQGLRFFSLGFLFPFFDLYRTNFVYLLQLTNYFQIFYISIKFSTLHFLRNNG